MLTLFCSVLCSLFIRIASKMYEHMQAFQLVQIMLFWLQACLFVVVSPTFL